MAIQQEVLSAEVMNFVIPIYFVEHLALAAVFFALRSVHIFDSDGGDIGGDGGCEGGDGGRMIVVERNNGGGDEGGGYGRGGRYRVDGGYGGGDDRGGGSGGYGGGVGEDEGGVV
ncbi:glycine-rich protein 2-like [Daucus carota subsp. sativus]|uniref:glycine-rich protein 2-like n=1 Tax=Daucus carota subsp. sativus TaxID=79200 RepID=UPI003083E479